MSYRWKQQAYRRFHILCIYYDIQRAACTRPPAYLISLNKRPPISVVPHIKAVDFMLPPHNVGFGFKSFLRQKKGGAFLLAPKRTPITWWPTLWGVAHLMGAAKLGEFRVFVRYSHGNNPVHRRKLCRWSGGTCRTLCAVTGLTTCRSVNGFSKISGARIIGISRSY